MYPLTPKSIKRPLEKRKHVVHTSLFTPEVTFVDAISASSAAPMYFPTYQMESGSWMIDGGVVTNNPTLLGLTHAKDYFKTNNVHNLFILQLNLVSGQRVGQLLNNDRNYPRLRNKLTQ